MNLAALQPGVTVNLGNPAQFNAQFNVSVLGGPASRTAITVDGGNIRNPIEGGPGQNFSQEVVQEFQISTANFDLSTGIAAFGAINVITRAGTNDFSGAAYFYHRDESLSAYPGLVRSTLTDNPEFSRQQTGFVLGGPLKKDKAHFFANYERTDQQGVYIVQPDLGRCRGSTRWPMPPTMRNAERPSGLQVSDKHSLFGRYSYDGNTNSGPFGTPVPASNFVSNDNGVHQSLFGITSVLSPTLINEFRFSHMYWKNRNTPAACVGDPNSACLGAGGPEVFYLNSVNFALGNNFNSPQGRDFHRFPVSNHTTWLKGDHQVKFGGTWEHCRLGGLLGLFRPGPRVSPVARVPGRRQPGAPGAVRPARWHHPEPGGPGEAAGRVVPARHRRSAQPSYKVDDARANNRYHLYAQDSWQATTR